MAITLVILNFAKSLVFLYLILLVYGIKTGYNNFITYSKVVLCIEAFLVSKGRMNTLFKINVDNLKETEKIGYVLGKLLNGGEIICMTGDLGAGKTTLTQSVAKGLDVEDYVTSPTFTIINEYKGRCPLYHFDVYRIGDIEEMYDLGYEEYFYSQGVAIIEWADIIEDILPEDRLNIIINKKEDMNSREIIIDGKGDKYLSIIDELRKTLPEAIEEKGVE